MLCHLATTTRQPPAPTILYVYCTGGTECFTVVHLTVTQHVPSDFAEWKTLSITREVMLSGFYHSKHLEKNKIIVFP